MTEHGVGPGDVTSGEGATDRCAADRFVDAVGAGDQRERCDFEVVFGAELAQQVDVAVAVTAEVEVVADDDHLRVEAVHEHSFDERLRRLCRLALVERDDHDRVDSRGGEQFHLLVGARQQSRGRLRADDGCRMPIEGDDRRHRTERFSTLTNVIDHGLVAEMDAVVGTDRDDGAATRPRRCVEIDDGLHPPEATQAHPRPRHLMHAAEPATFGA